MGKEEYFLNYNLDSLMKHLLAVEDHARNLKDSYKVEHVSCITKHLLQAEEQSDEAISHSSVVQPNNTGTFAVLRSEIIRLRDKLSKGINQVDLINNVRNVRRRVEKLNPAYDIEKCEVCTNAIDSLTYKTKDINRNIDNKDVYTYKNGDKFMDTKTFGVIQGSQVLGFGVKELGNYVDKKMELTAQPNFKKASTYIDLVGGLTAAVASLYMKSGSQDTKLGLAVVGSQRLADKVIELAKGYMPATSGGMTYRSPMGSRAMPPSTRISPVMNADNGLVKVD